MFDINAHILIISANSYTKGEIKSNYIIHHHVQYSDIGLACITNELSRSVVSNIRSDNSSASGDADALSSSSIATVWSSFSTVKAWLSSLS
jgi:hypothetical protein